VARLGSAERRRGGSAYWGRAAVPTKWVARFIL